MINILANDGLHSSGKKLLEENGYHVSVEKIPQEELIDRLNDFDAVFVRSDTTISQEIIEASPNIKLIGRAGVGMDNIDVKFAKSRGVKVINTPEASSASVAELTIGHLFNLNRFLHLSNREMPLRGETDFKILKKACSKGTELAGKTLGIIGLGRIGKALAARAIGLGMNVVAYKRKLQKVNIELNFHSDLQMNPVKLKLQTVTFEEVLKTSDFVSLHVPGDDDKDYLIGRNEMMKMKDGACLINVARGGVVDESALLEALDSGKLRSAALDVFENEPQPAEAILLNPKISLSPHIGASTAEAQERIGVEIAQKTIKFFQMHETV